MNMTRKTYANEWIEAIRQILGDAGDLWGLASKEPGGPVQSHASDSHPITGNGQMLLPGIAEPHRWDFGRGQKL